MATTVGRGTQSMNIYIKPIMRKAAYHKKGNPGETVKMNGGEELEMKGKGFAVGAGDHQNVVVDGNPEWVPDHRTGIFYPKGQEKVIADVPLSAAGKDDVRINWFSNHEDFI
ncbi:uncharacterized protein LOC124913411 [Impatiens glandulifera]|uniref:uncharacterized protein LOC124913411 n=1 Tax=Impatiens glandulifera TaxID=253017 RepID=UPI001FB05479|nr:uncharacterized protein LOC124913411 [Impatiens glandulifera]